ncbi:MAG: glycosyltransferase family 1 protein [Phycisphaerales bacterium]|nr:glycosyltransferase family 1 protein [Phycisphaerales bacterium]
MLFTDTLGDVNGVSRFIRTIAEQALGRGVELHVLTSTRFTCPQRSNVHNVKPRYARPMPAYPTLDIVWPDAGALTRLAERLAPDVVHVSTPGPVGSVGRRFALRRGLPLVGTYHTDFPAYVDHLLDDRVLTWVTEQSMRRFYKPFARVFTRSDDYAKALVGIGVGRERIIRLLPGIDTAAFDIRRRDPSGAVWDGVSGARRGSVKALYVGRVSIEKNLELLVKVWKRVAEACAAGGLDAQLVVVGDGPYRGRMERELAGTGAVFAGFRHGDELATIYASSDLFVFPSTTDTLGQVVMEAQCAGLAVLVSDQGGPSEVVDDGVTGRVLSATRPGDWEGAMLELIRDADLRKRMGLAGHVKIAPMSISHSFEQFWAVHADVVRSWRR